MLSPICCLISHLALLTGQKQKILAFKLNKEGGERSFCFHYFSPSWLILFFRSHVYDRKTLRGLKLTFGWNPISDERIANQNHIHKKEMEL